MRTQYLLACSLLTIIPGLCPSAQAAPNDHLDAIIRGPAFGELGKHGQAVALYLAAIQAPSWAESERLLQRIWDEYPGSAPVDVAHAFAGRHYRDAGDKTQAIAHFEQALRAARGRARPWTALLQGELSALGERVAQAPGPPGGAPAADEWVEVTPDSGLGEWTSVPPVQTLVTPLPEERAWSFEASIPDPQTWAFPASLHLTGPLVVVAASFRVKAPPDVAFSVQFVDADGTTVIARSRGVQPDEDGWRSFAIDFARQGLNQISIVGIRTADAVMGPLDCIQLVLEPPIPLGAPPLEIVVSDLKLRLGDPVRGSAGPQIVTDDAGWRWLSSTCQVRLDDTVIREGVPSVRVSAEVGPSAPQDARKSVVALPPVEGSPWLGDRLVFWCLPRTTPYLEVCIVSGKPDAIDTSEGSTLKGGGMGLVKVLDADDLTVGEWNHVEIAFADIRTRFNMEDTFGEIDTVSFSPGSREQGGREAFSKPGEYVWYISGLHVEGQGPVIFRRPGPAIRDVGLDATWFAEGACTLQPEGRTTATGPGALRMDVAFTDDSNSGGEARAVPPGGGAWLGTRLRFACRAENLPLLIVTACDSDGTTVMWRLDDRDLVPSQWQSIELSPETQPNMGSGDDRMDDLASLVFSCNRAWDRKGEWTAAGVVGTWYLDDLEIEGPPMATRPRPIGPGLGVRDDSGTPATWTGWGRVMVDRELVTVRDGATSVRLAVLPERTGLHEGRARAELDTPVTAGKLRFWVYPRQVGVLTVRLFHTEDRGRTSVSTPLARWQLAGDRLVPNTWNEVVLLASEGRVPPQASAAPQPESANELVFDVAGAGPEGDEQPTWYIDGLELVEGE